ncbi:hypothetical protein LBMAG33_2350 [Candidatus Levyibacteriota bacterium]|nr:hypothetical protein [Candidatus Levybacteria bacterium]MSU25883.1 hypothetical protein [Candidatus Levybacteria bacterium]GDX61925.1 hypothetical protein LBMAG33_2350 [Candidatus Levybacteria bacterium]
MTKKQIKDLVITSYKSDDELDEATVEKLTDLLSRTQLKQYIIALKKYEEDKSVLVKLATLPSIDEEKKLKEVFPNKKIVFDVDPSIITGMRVVNKDIISEYNLKNTLDNLIAHITENYD